MKDKQNKIGERIKKRRKEARLSLGALAEDAEVSKSYLSRLESGAGAVRPSGRTIYNIARALGTTMADLLGREVLVDDPADYPKSLVEFAAKHGIGPRDQKMLAQINFRGRHPETVDDWVFLWNAIQRSVPARKPARTMKPAGAAKRKKPSRS